jgi:hypothetical protein
MKWTAIPLNNSEWLILAAGVRLGPLVDDDLEI